MRRFSIPYLVILLVLSFVRDPFFHLHDGHEHEPGEPGHEHLALPLHTHIESGPSSAHDDDEFEIVAVKAFAKAQPFSLFQFRPEIPQPLPVLTQEQSLLTSLVFSIAKVSEPPPRAHDPPFVHSSIPRSPPV